MNRRKLLKLASLTGLSFVCSTNRLLVPQARAQVLGEQPPQTFPSFFVLIPLGNGLDVTLGLDPRSHAQDGTTQSDVFIEYRDSDIIRAGNLMLGPSSAALAKWSHDIAIVNGVHMRRDAGHETCLSYAASGSSLNDSLTVPLELASLMPHGSLGVISQDAPSNPPHNLATLDFDGVLKMAPNQNSTNEMPLPVLGQNLISTLRRKSEAARATLEPLADLANETVDTNNPVASFQHRARVLAKVMQLGLARFAELGLNLDGIDSHQNHEGTHIQEQTQVWQAVADLFQIFKDTPYGHGSLFDYTTFMAVSEFSRTPYLNSSKGKDHNALTNSMLIAGRGIKGNQVIGASRVIKMSSTGTPAQHRGAVYDYAGKSVMTKLPAELEKSLSSSKKEARRLLQQRQIGLIHPENVIHSIAPLFATEKKGIYLQRDGAPGDSSHVATLDLIKA